MKMKIILCAPSNTQNDYRTESAIKSKLSDHDLQKCEYICVHKTKNKIDPCWYLTKSTSGHAYTYMNVCSIMYMCIADNIIIQSKLENVNEVSVRLRLCVCE